MDYISINKAIYLLSIAFLITVTNNIQSGEPEVKLKRLKKMNVLDKKFSHVKFKVLKNGMVIIVRVVKTVPKVSIQLWYRVGSSYEEDKERGIAHLIEHMIFKGTDMLSESDINTIVHALSGSCNAFTSYDYTGYLFNLPSYNWHEALPIMADCMQNCRFDEQMLNSEMKAVIQELKMYKDKYVRVVIDNLVAVIFAEHPYHHPIIGYKQDLWSVTSEDLKKFYKKHYAPNNAALVVVGDVDPEDVFDRTQKEFEHIPPHQQLEHPEFYHNYDIASHTVTLYRDIKQPMMVMAFVTPGAKQGLENIANIVAWVLGKGRGSRLYRRLVEELQIATSLDAGAYDLFDHGLGYIVCQPRSLEYITQIEKEIMAEIKAIQENGLAQDEVLRAVRQTQMGIYDLMEDTESQAYELGKYYFATGNPEYIYTFLADSLENFHQQAEEYIRKWFRESVMHKGYVLPLAPQDYDIWHIAQENSDLEDEKILSARQRTTPVEEPKYALTLEPKEPKQFNYPKAKIHTLSNGIRILSYPNDNTPKIDIVIDFKVQSFYDTDDKPGLITFMSIMLQEGTKKHSCQQITDMLEARGISLSSYAGGMALSLPKEELEFALSVVEEILIEPSFNPESIEKVRAQMIAQLRSFWDTPTSVSSQLIRDTVYQGHPYSKNALGTFASLESITREDLIACYKKYISHDGTRIAVVGEFIEKNMLKAMETHLGVLKGEKVPDIKFPAVKTEYANVLEHPMTRDQIVLSFAGKTVARKDEDFDALILFDQIFGGGLLGSMSSRLFDLREQSGLFYTINGSFVVGADEQPGLFILRTIVSLDRLAEAEKAIRHVIDVAVDSLTEQELDEARRAIVNSLVDYFASNHGMAEAFLFLDRYGFPQNYFDIRNQQLSKITIQQVKNVVKKYAKSDEMLMVRVGRVDQLKKKSCVDIGQTSVFGV